MKLQSKFFLWLAPALVGIYGFSQFAQQWHSRNLLEKSEVTNLGHLNQLTQSSAESVQAALLSSVRNSMKEGNMDSVQKVLSDQNKIRQLVEFSVANNKGTVQYSSDPSCMKKPLPPELKEGLLSRPDVVIRKTNGVFEVYQPQVAEASCVECHTDWKKGGIGGVAYVRLSTVDADAVAKSLEATTHQLQHDDLVGASITFAGMVMAIGVLIVGVTQRLITRPFQRLGQNMLVMAEGDFSQDVPTALRGRNDEIGELARACQTMSGNTRQLIVELSKNAQTLASSATELSAVSSQTSGGVTTMSQKTATVAAAAEEASANSLSVAAGMEQAVTNLASVAGATEEMSATVGEIAANSEKARCISEQATAQAQNITVLMQQLGQAAQDIGKVTETITDISSQTNLLALNATIEAARAGAAGKGFAVVANEIKELARQTAVATEDIKTRISGVQMSAGSAISDIEKISAVIKDVGAIITSIAAAIEQQATTTKDVAANIAQASSGVKDSNERVAQTASVSKTIAKDVAEINAAVGEVRQGGEQVQLSAAELSKLAEQLRCLVDRFKVTAQSAPPLSQEHSGPALGNGHGNGKSSLPGQRMKPASLSREEPVLLAE